MNSYTVTSAKGESHTFNAACLPDALNWIVNHLDCSEEWFVAPTNTPPLLLLQADPGQPLGHRFIHEYEYQILNPESYSDELVSLYVGPEDEDYDSSWAVVRKEIRIALGNNTYELCESKRGDLWAFVVQDKTD